MFGTEAEGSSRVHSSQLILPICTKTTPPVAGQTKIWCLPAILKNGYGVPSHTALQIQGSWKVLSVLVSPCYCICVHM